MYQGDWNDHFLKKEVIFGHFRAFPVVFLHQKVVSGPLYNILEAQRCSIYHMSTLTEMKKTV